MRSRRWFLAASFATILLLGLGAEQRKLAERWSEPGFEGQPFRKLLVIGITSDSQARRNFENLFVSHLRGKGIECVTSYSMVADLGKIDSAQRQEILHLIDEHRIDGAISVRAVPLAKLGETEWAAQWNRDLQGNQTLRQLIEQTLPVAGKKSRRYGVEVALWGAEDWRRVWAARTDPYTRDGMREGAADFVQSVMLALDADGLIR